ncbi:MAG: alpha/beta hydrolase [Lysobacter sp.]|nr:alpha/beta hydrolase [Lysobacter sp.]
MTDLCILPGLDGTTRMLRHFMAAVQPSFASVAAIAYPTDVALDYRDLEVLVRDALPRSPFVLLGESFSGPIAISIAADPPPNLIGLVLSTSFARAPVPLLMPFAALTRLAPVRMVPTAILSAVLLGRWSTSELRRELRSALGEVAPGVLRARAAAAMRVDVSDRLAHIAVPTLSLKANHDRLLHAGAGRQLIDAIADASPAALDGPHLLLQTHADRCAAEIARFAARLAH